METGSQITTFWGLPPSPRASVYAEATPDRTAGQVAVLRESRQIRMLGPRSQSGAFAALREIDLFTKNNLVNKIGKVV